MVRAKFRVETITKTATSPDGAIIELKAVCADEVPENQRFHKWTPSGSLHMTVNNPAAVEQFVLGQEYYVDFTPAVAAG